MSEYITSIERRELFDIMCHEATACQACPRMADRTAVLSRRNGTLIPKVLLVGEAPGRLGADRTHRPFTGDQSGQRFDELLASIDMDREEVFITNAVLCCPTDNQQNLSPQVAEVRNCGKFLRETLSLLAPPVVVTLGAVALRAVGRLINQPLVLAGVLDINASDKAARFIRADFLLVPLYHPSPRVLHTVRSFEQQKADMAAVREAIEHTTTLAR